MDEDLARWSEIFLCTTLPMEPSEYGGNTDLSTDPASMGGFDFPNMPAPSDLHCGIPIVATSFAAPYFPASVSTGQRQQLNPLQIDTQVKFYQESDPECSTGSSTSLSRVLATPSSQLYNELQSPIYITSPQSAPPEWGPRMFCETTSPHPMPSTSYYHSQSTEDDTFNIPVEQEDVIQVPLPHILEWRRVVELCGTNDFVPQSVYQPYTEADRKRYIQDVDLQETILFHSNGSYELGISLDDILKQKLKHLKDRDDRMFVGCGPSVSIRIQWPGYPSWSKQIPTMDFKNPKGPITRAKLAKNVANCIRRFAEVAQNKPMEAGSDRRWKIGRRIKVEDLILVSLHHVSKGSWQPQLRVRHREHTSTTSNEYFPSFPPP